MTSSAAASFVAFLALAWALASCSAPPERSPPADAEDLRGLPFDRLHSPSDDPDGGALILGALKTAGQAAGERSKLLGRWEGYDLGLPVPRDWKIVLFLHEIEGDKGRATVWAGTNLQRPKLLARFPVEIRGEGEPALSWRLRMDGAERTFSFRYDSASDRLLGAVGLAFPGGPKATESWALGRERRFLVYRDYPAYLAGKRIGAVAFQDPALTKFGKGCLVYLPPGYESAPDRKWPLVLFFCGSGDRGAPLEDLAKASPFMFIRERGDLPAVIAAPALDEAFSYASFPTEYMAGVLDELLSRYRVDPSRVAVTGLSMGGEATIRFALTSPERFAAAAPLSMADPRFDADLRLVGYKATDIPYRRAASVPFYVANGGRDPWIHPEAVKRTVEAMRAAGVKATWKLLPENGHDVWTDTYSDPAFYGWLLSKRSGARAARPADFGEGVWIKKYPGGNACFKFETPSGIKIVADPYAMDESLAPDIVTESHQDADHTDVSRLTGAYALLKGPGEYAAKGIRISGIPGKHNKPDAGTTNTIFVFEIDGIKIAHFASQGALLDERMWPKLKGIDVLLIQGTMSESYREQKLTGEDCRRIIDRLRPRIVIPEHGTPRIGEYLAKRLGARVEYVPAEGIVVRKEDLRGAGAPRIVDMDNEESAP